MAVKKNKACWRVHTGVSDWLKIVRSVANEQHGSLTYTPDYFVATAEDFGGYLCDVSSLCSDSFRSSMSCVIHELLIENTSSWCLLLYSAGYCDDRVDHIFRSFFCRTHEMKAEYELISLAMNDWDSEKSKAFHFSI